MCKRLKSMVSTVTFILSHSSHLLNFPFVSFIFIVLFDYFVSFVIFYLFVSVVSFASFDEVVLSSVVMASSPLPLLIATD